MSLLQDLGKDLFAQLTRLGITSCSKWAEKTRYMMTEGGAQLWSFDKHPWTREMHDCWAEMVVGQKAAQMGFTECAMNKVFYSIDIKKKSVLYILPSYNSGASNFSSSRFDPALELSPHLKSLFSNVNKVGHKRAGACNLFVRGTRSKEGLKSDPTGVMIFDEVEEMTQDHIPLAFERMSGQDEKHAFMLSTPSTEGHGINGYFKDSNQKEFFFPCPYCRKQTRLVFPDCLVITADNWYDKGILNSHYICKECKHKLPQEDKKLALQKGIWVPKNDSIIEGFHISQLYSSTVNAHQLAIAYLKGEINPADRQEFYNSKLGLPYSPKGAKITDAQINACIGDYTQFDSCGPGLITMGVDVGTKLHYEINQWFVDAKGVDDINLSAQPRVIKEGYVDEFEDIDPFMDKFSVLKCVMDRQPERRKAEEFARRFPGRVNLCLYNTGLNGRTIKPPKKNEEGNVVGVDRTSWCDVALGRFEKRRIALPKDLCQEYKPHIKAQTKIIIKDANGNPYAVYRAPNKNTPDHLAHCRVYNEVALKLVASSSNARNISGIL